MNKKPFQVFILCVVILSGLGMIKHVARAANHESIFMDKQSVDVSQAAQTPSPTVPASILVEETPEPRILPPVGNNAGLVLGASVLVLIIIGGVVFSSRRKPKH